MSSRRIASEQLGLPLGENPPPIETRSQRTAHCRFCHIEIDLPSWVDPQAVNLLFCRPECRRAWAEQTPSLRVCLDGRLGRRGANWELQSALARQRDGFRCRECGISEEELGRQLDVHHLIPFSSFRSSVDANQLENLVGVCPSCHNRLEARLRRELPLFRQP